jgi:sugar-specific transcriptional regulator TrmB
MPLTALEKLGFTSKQRAVYVACLELGGARASDIARKARVERTTSYNILSDLIKSGLITQSKQGDSYIFIAEDPRILEKQCQEKLQIAKNLLPELEAIHNVTQSKPKISFYEGWEGAKKIYEDGLETLKPGEILLNYTGFEEYLDYMPREYLENYIKRRVQKKIRIKIISPYSKTADEFYKRAVKELREMRITAVKQWNFTGDIHIYKNKVGIISFKDNFMSVLIESQEIADMQRAAFELMWIGAEKING